MPSGPGPSGPPYQVARASIQPSIFSESSRCCGARARRGALTSSRAVLSARASSSARRARWSPRTARAVVTPTTTAPSEMSTTHATRICFERGSMMRSLRETARCGASDLGARFLEAQTPTRQTDAETRGAQVFSMGVKVTLICYCTGRRGSTFWLTSPGGGGLLSLGLGLLGLRRSSLLRLLRGGGLLGRRRLLAHLPLRLRASPLEGLGPGQELVLGGLGAVLLHVEVHQLLQNLLSLADDGVHLVRDVRVDQIVELLLELAVP